MPRSANRSPRHGRRPASLGKHYVEETPAFDLEKEADRIIWERSRNAGLVVNERS